MIHLFFLALFMSSAPVDQKTAESRVRALKSEAKAAAKLAGCGKAADCKALPMGSRACGGPSDFLVYCAATSDEAKLKALAKGVTEAETAYNGKFGVTSICAVLPAPQLRIKDGACTAEAPKAADVPM